MEGVNQYTLPRHSNTGISIIFLHPHSPTDAVLSAEGPLPEEVVAAFEDCYAKVRGSLPNYSHDPAWYDPKKYGY